MPRHHNGHVPVAKPSTRELAKIAAARAAWKPTAAEHALLAEAAREAFEASRELGELQVQQARLAERVIATDAGFRRLFNGLLRLHDQDPTLWEGKWNDTTQAFAVQPITTVKLSMPVPDPAN